MRKMIIPISIVVLLIAIVFGTVYYLRKDLNPLRAPSLGADKASVESKLCQKYSSKDVSIMRRSDAKGTVGGYIISNKSDNPDTAFTEWYDEKGTLVFGTTPNSKPAQDVYQKGVALEGQFPHETKIDCAAELKNDDNKKMSYFSQQYGFTLEYPAKYTLEERAIGGDALDALRIYPKSYIEASPANAKWIEDVKVEVMDVRGREKEWPQDGFSVAEEREPLYESPDDFKNVKLSKIDFNGKIVGQIVADKLEPHYKIGEIDILYGGYMFILKFQGHESNFAELEGIAKSIGFTKSGN